jgi:hypothetical protein
MRNWGTIVTGFYILVVAGLSPAVALLLLLIGDQRSTDVQWSRLVEWYSEWWVLTWMVLLVIGPLVLLIVSVDRSRERPKRRRHIAISATAAGFALALLVFAAVASVAAVVVGDDSGDVTSWIVLASWPSAWLVWTLVFWRLGERLFDPARRIYRWLVAGSVLELLVAVPSYLIVRQRHECSAPVYTAFGIATGLAILLMSLGPGALFLYGARMRRLSPRPESESPRS